MIKLSRPICPHPTALQGGNYKHPLNKVALKNASYDKCMYCESKISHIDFANVEHFRPKANDKFPELEFDWGNLGYACSKCNTMKSNKFDSDLPYVDPYNENPSNFFYATGALLFIKNGSERSEISIRDIGLNRPELLEKRLVKINEIQKAINACFRTRNESLKSSALDELDQESSSDKEYSFFISALLRAHAA